ncbi:MAG: GGDEF domain-containing protein [Spongiibacteraceae bacterium]
MSQLNQVRVHCSFKPVIFQRIFKPKVIILNKPDTMTDALSVSSLISSEAIQPICPVGEPRCERIDELLILQEEVAVLSEQARTDPLTGLFNFRHFRAALALEMERTQRTQQTTALLMVDLDHFKTVNDNWGHEAGNMALRSTAKLIQKIIRRLDIPCRYGGEEFAIILPATDLLTAIAVAERIRVGIASTPVFIGEKELTLTASLGVEVYTAQQYIERRLAKQQDTSEQLVQRADACLYRAKQQGRNQVCHSDFSGDKGKATVSKAERQLISGFFGKGENNI